MPMAISKKHLVVPQDEARDNPRLVDRVNLIRYWRRINRIEKRLFSICGLRGSSSIIPGHPPQNILFPSLPCSPC